MRLKGLLEPLETGIELKKILQSINEKTYPVGIYGLSDSGKSYMIDGIFENIEKSIVIVTQNDMEAKNLYEDLILYTNEVYYFPVKETVFYNIDAVSGDLRWARLNVINEILNNKNKKIVITSIDSFMATYAPHKLFIKYSMTIKQGTEINFNEMSSKLIESGYERVEIVESKGQFSVRGGILDIFPTCSTYPYRVELFGDEIESIRTFNSESQRSIDKVKSFKVFPAKEILVSQESMNKAKESILNEFKKISSHNKEKERIEKLEKVVKSNIESLEENLTFETIDSYLPYFYDEIESFFDYFKNYLFIMNDVKRCKGKLESSYLEFAENFTSFLERGDILPGQEKLLINEHDTLDKFEKSNILFFETLNNTEKFLKPFTSIELKQTTLSNYQGM